MTPAERVAKRKKPSPRAPWGTLKFAGTWRCTLRACRQSLGLTLADVSRAVGLSVAGLQRIEVGIDPVLSNARKLADFYGKTVEELWPELAGEKQK